MILYRFMSDGELKMFLEGMTVSSRQSVSVRNSTQPGFLFFDDSKPIESRIPLMVGKADISNVAEFEVINRYRFTKSVGEYSNPRNDEMNLSRMGIAELFHLVEDNGKPTVMVKQYHATEYNQNDLKILRIGTPGVFTGIRKGEYMVKWKEVLQWMI